MLDTNLKTQLQAYLGKLQRPIRLIASLDDQRRRGRDERAAAGDCRTLRSGQF